MHLGKQLKDACGQQQRYCTRIRGSKKARDHRAQICRYKGGEWSWLLVIGRLQSLYIPIHKKWNEVHILQLDEHSWETFARNFE